MTTLLSVYNSEGCVGAGIQKALDNTRELAESWIERARANGQDVVASELATAVTHEPLFGLAEVT